MGYEAKFIPLREAVELVKHLSGESPEAAEAELRAALREGVVRAKGIHQEFDPLSGVITSTDEHKWIRPEIWDCDNFVADFACTYEAEQEVRAIRIRVLRQDIVRIWHPDGHFNATRQTDRSRAQMSDLVTRYKGGDVVREDMDQIPVLVEGQRSQTRPTGGIGSPNGTSEGSLTESVSHDSNDCEAVPVGRPPQSQWIVNRLIERAEAGDELQGSVAGLARNLCREYNSSANQDGQRPLAESTAQKVIRPMLRAYQQEKSIAAMRDANALRLESERLRKKTRGN